MWWNNSVFYQVYISKFNDSNHDGIGDIQGIIDQLPYLKSLGIDALWITPFYPHSKEDGGYDVKDYRDVAPEYGTLDDFKKLIKLAHNLAIKIVIDLVINHSSTRHPWFKKSAQNIAPYSDYYIWKDRINNWESFFSGKAWKFSEPRNQYYYSSFSKKQADLNWNNPNVLEEFKTLIEFWLDLGIDGFRFDVVNNLSVDDDFQDNPVVNGQQVHIYDCNKIKVKDILKQLFTEIPEHVCKIAEISSNNAFVINHYLEDGLFDLAFNFNFLDIHRFKPQYLIEEIKNTMMSLPHGHKPTLVFSSHDEGRSYNRLAKGNKEYTKLIAFFLLTAHGVPFIFQGEELGMKNKAIDTLEEIDDIRGLNMHQEEVLKTGDKNQALKKALFETRDYSRNFIDFTESQDSLEFLNLYTDLIDLRKTLDFNQQPYSILESSDEVLQYSRGDYLFVLNISENEWIAAEFKNDAVIHSTIKNNTHTFESYEAKILKRNVKS